MIVVTLISARGRAGLSQDIADAAAALLGSAAADWLEPGVACDLRLPAPPAPETLAELRAPARRGPPRRGGAGGGRRGASGFLIADMDSTMIGEECIDELAAIVGIKDAVADDHRARDERRDRLRAGPESSASRS